VKVDKSRINSILLITLSNIGDVVLTIPVLRVLEREFPAADITVLAGPNTTDVFESDPAVSKVIAYNKHMSFSEKLRLVLSMRKKGFDLLVDLRNSLFPLLIGARYSTPLFKKGDPKIHRRDKHLQKLEAIGISISNAPFSIPFTRDDKLHVNAMLSELGILPDDNMIAIAAGAKSHTKRWPSCNFVRLCDRVTKELGVKALLVGDESDKAINEEIAGVGSKEVYDLSGRTNIRELAYLFSLCRLLVTNDSAPLHIASAVELPTIAIFGPTDHIKYGPLSTGSIVLKKGLKCSPCEKALCKFELECMREITADHVFSKAKDIYGKQGI